MRNKIKLIVGILAVLPAFHGCGEKNVPTPDPVAPLMAEHNGPESRSDESAVTVVKNFLEATLKEDHAALRSLLTPSARRKLEERGVPFSLAPGDSASFVVDKSIPKGKLGAYVPSTLHNVDRQGRRESVEIVWIVALCEEGWRIAGAAVALFEGQEKTVVNFEDPEAAVEAIAEAERKDLQRRREAGPIRQVRYNDGPIR